MRPAAACSPPRRRRCAPPRAALIRFGSIDQSTPTEQRPDHLGDASAASYSTPGGLPSTSNSSMASASGSPIAGPVEVDRLDGVAIQDLERLTGVMPAWNTATTAWPARSRSSNSAVTIARDCGNRHQLEPQLRDDAEHALGADEQLGQLEAGRALPRLGVDRAGRDDAPSASTTSRPSTQLAVEPYLTARMPWALVEAMPPTVHIRLEPGSGGKISRCGASNPLSRAWMMPGSIIA